MGGAGFIGSHLVDALTGRGHFVRVFDRPNIDTSNLACSLPFIEVVGGDISNEADIKTALSGIDTLIHLVSTTLPKGSNDNPIYDAETNIVGSLKLITLAKELGVQKIVFASSGGTVYGDPIIQPIPETHPTNPICSYGISKLAIEKYLHLFHHLHGLDYVVLRIANPFGERQNPFSGQGAVTTFLWRALTGEPITIWGDGTVARDYFHISDLISAFICTIEGTPPSHIYNIGGGKAHSLKSVLEVIAEITEKPLNLVFAPTRKLDVPVNCLDISRARDELAWAPKLSLEEGVAKTWAWIKNSNRGTRT